MIFGCMADKDYEEHAGAVSSPAFGKWFSRRSKEAVPRIRRNCRRCGPDPTLPLHHARPSRLRGSVSQPDDTVVVCGSLYLIGEVRSVLESEGHGGLS